MSDAAKAVFLSYAREDADAARRIGDALRSQGVEVWFDQSELRGGDAWDAKIRKQIKECALFLPIISHLTQERGEGYFRLEWKLAVERTHLMAEGMTFLAPVVIDGTPEGGALVPAEFMRVQWTRLPDGLPTSSFVAQVKRLLESGGKKTLEAGRSRPAQLGDDAASPAKVGRRVPAAAWLLAAAAVALAVGLIWWRKPGAEPNPAAGTRPLAVAAPTTPAITDKSIAVLPFENMSEDKGNAFFADGMQEDILTNLALIREFRVVSRTSAMAYRNTTKSMRQIAQELGVAYILEGSVQRAGNKVRVTGQLIKAATDEHIWAQAYDRDLSDVFGIQAELSQSIAKAMKTALSPQETAMITQRTTDNPAAYDRFLKSRSTFNGNAYTVKGRADRIQDLQAVVEMDPNFAQAWGSLADVYAFACFNEDDDKDALMAKSKAAMDRALQLAPDNPDVIASYGRYFYWGYRDYARAVEQYQRLAQLQPNVPRVFSSLALIQRRQGHWAESLANSRRAVELDPSSPTFLDNLKSTLVAARRWDEAITIQRRIAALFPDRLETSYTLGALAFQATGSTREGDAFFTGLKPEQFNSPRGIHLRLSWALETGNFAEAVRLDRLQPYFDGDGAPRWQQAYSAAVAYLALGDTTAARVRVGDFPAELRLRLQREPGNLNNYFYLAGMETVLGHGEEARRLVDRVVELMPLSRDALDGASYAAYRAAIYDWTGDKEYALAEYKRILQIPTPSFGSVHELKAGYSTLHGDPRFEAMLADPKNNAPLF